MNGLRFDDRVIVISGAGRGIGRGYALFLAQLGARVIVNDTGGSVTGEGATNVTCAADVVAEITQQGGDATASTHDVSDFAGARAIIDLALERYGQVDGVIANAGITSPRVSFTELATEDLQRMIAVQFYGTWGLFQAAWPHLAAHKRGRALVTTSQAALYGMPDDPAYAAAKGANRSLARSLALEGAAAGIKVNAIAPAAYTRMVQHTLGDAALRATVERVAPAHLVAPGAALLVHDACPVTGETFVCGSGHFARAFTGETQGITLPEPAFTPETLLERIDEVCNETGYRVPRTMFESGSRGVRQSGDAGDTISGKR